MRRADLDDTIAIPMPTLGEVEAGGDDDHQPHSFLYVPDLSVETGWSAHRVPERAEKVERGRRPMGFRR